MLICSYVLDWSADEFDKLVHQVGILVGYCKLIFTRLAFEEAILSLHHRLFQMLYLLILRCPSVVEIPPLVKSNKTGVSLL